MLTLGLDPAAIWLPALCPQCGRPMPAGLRRDARYCSTSCRQAAWRDAPAARITPTVRDADGYECHCDRCPGRNTPPAREAPWLRYRHGRAEAEQQTLPL